MSPNKDSRRLFFREAISQAIAHSMAADDRIIVLGQDVGHYGGPYQEFRGLYEQFGAKRIRDTAVAEANMIGLGVGAAAAGLRPLVSITYMDFLMLGFDPLINYAAKARFKTGGQLSVPLVVKTTAGAKGQGVAHSQCIEAWLMSVPGLKVVAPSSPTEAYGLMKLALQCDGPIVYVDHKRLFPIAGMTDLSDEPAPIGTANVCRPGRDITVVSHSYMLRHALDAAKILAAEQIECEVIDLRSLAPLDVETLCKSVARTRNLLTVEEGQTTCGVGSEVAFQVQERIGPVKVARLGALPAPVSSNPVLEAACLPDTSRVVAAIHKILGIARSERT